MRLSRVSPAAPSVLPTPSPAGAALRSARWLAAICTASLTLSQAANASAEASFKRDIEPLLKKYCYDCHGDGMEKGGVAFDGFVSDAALVSKHSLWLAALRNTRAGMMPPHEDGVERPTEVELAKLSNWIKYQAFGINPANPDPGRVTVRRLNRVEYRNTIRDLMGFDFNSEVEFPPDDSGHGFDNNGDVLTISPLLLEKYLAAAETIVDKAVPKVARVMRERTATGRDFRGESGNGEQLNAKVAKTVARTFRVDEAATYQVVLEFEVRGSFDFDPAHAKLICRIDGEEKHVEDVVWSERRTVRKEYEFTWQPGEHTISFEIEPLPPVNVAAVAQVLPPPPAATEPAATPGAGAATASGSTPVVAPPQARRNPPAATRVDVRIASVQVRGPIDPKFWIAPDNHARFFPDGPAPEEPAARERYLRQIVQQFATRAFRRPIAPAMLDQLVKIARDYQASAGRTFEEGVGRAMMAVLASPRFLFRVEEPIKGAAGQAFAPVDDYALASRLSYFFWSTMPDEELFGLAERGELRRELRAQVARMLKDPRSQAFIRHFTGQWLQARDVESIPINARVIFGQNAPQAIRNREGRVDFDSPFRKLMRSETEMYFEHVIREDRSLLELIDSDYTFLNDKLASFYGVPDVTGENLRLVKLPADSVRGGVLTQGTVLTVTSNPTRTSPVKRGLFILENILGTPPPPPPPDIPDLEEARKEFKDREPKLSEMLAVHRTNAMCRSCHERMDPMGLALENFNALGAWRDTDAKQPIETAGKLITGESFANVRELKKILATERGLDVYRCLTEKLMTYALGRGIEHYDMHTIDEITATLEREGGKVSVLINGVVESPAFQKTRTATPAAGSVSVNTP